MGVLYSRPKMKSLEMPDPIRPPHASGYDFITQFQSEISFSNQTYVYFMDLLA